MASKYPESGGAKFPIGKIVLTPGAAGALHKTLQITQASALIRRHASGDWGDMPQEDKEQNDQMINFSDNGMLMSSYRLLPTGETIWIITNWAGEERTTTLLLPDEY